MSKKLYAKVGGQAVIEGIMMRSPKKDVLAVRDQNGNIVVEPMVYKTIKGKYKFFKLPVVRGVVGFIDSLIVGYKSLMRSAEFFASEEDEKKTEKITFEDGSETVVREGYTVCVGISLGSESVRVTMRRPFAEPDTAQALESSRREAEQYRLALEELGINTEEVVS